MRIEIEMERVESTTLAVSFSALRGVSFVSVAAVVVVEGCEEEEEETSVAAAAVAGLKSRRDCAGRRQPHNAGQGEAAGNVTVALEVTGGRQRAERDPRIETRVSSAAGSTARRPRPHLPASCPSLHAFTCFPSPSLFHPLCPFVRPQAGWGAHFPHGRGLDQSLKLAPYSHLGF